MLLSRPDIFEPQRDGEEHPPATRRNRLPRFRNQEDWTICDVRSGGAARARTLIVVVPPGSAWAKEAEELARLDAAMRGMNAELRTAHR